MFELRAMRRWMVWQTIRTQQLKWWQNTWFRMCSMTSFFYLLKRRNMALYKFVFNFNLTLLIGYTTPCTEASLPFVTYPAIIGRTPSLGHCHHDMEQGTSHTYWEVCVFVTESSLRCDRQWGLSDGVAHQLQLVRPLKAIKQQANIRQWTDEKQTERKQKTRKMH